MGGGRRIEGLRSAGRGRRRRRGGGGGFLPVRKK